MTVKAMKSGAVEFLTSRSGIGFDRCDTASAEEQRKSAATTERACAMQERYAKLTVREREIHAGYMITRHAWGRSRLPSTLGTTEITVECAARAGHAQDGSERAR